MSKLIYNAFYMADRAPDVTQTWKNSQNCQSLLIYFGSTVENAHGIGFIIRKTDMFLNMSVLKFLNP